MKANTRTSQNVGIFQLLQYLTDYTYLSPLQDKGYNRNCIVSYCAYISHYSVPNRTQRIPSVSMLCLDPVLSYSRERLRRRHAIIAKSSVPVFTDVALDLSAAVSKKQNALLTLSVAQNT